MNDSQACNCSICGVQEQSLCANCCNEMIDLIRNSCIELDNIKHASQQEIDRVFGVSQKLQTETKKVKIKGNDVTPIVNGDSGTEQSSDLTRSPSKKEMLDLQAILVDKGIPIASDASIKVLTHQLLKLQIVNERVKIIGIEKTHDALKKRNTKLSMKTQNLRELIKTEREKLEMSRAKISENFTKRNLQLENDKVFEYLKVSRVKKQTVRLQSQNYNTLSEIVFSKSKSSNTSYLSKLQGKKQLLFFSQPVINIENFFAYNNKLEQLNTFLEKLIILQIKLLEVFDEELSTLTLPHLKELESLLPNQKFFALVREKEIQMVGNEPEVDSEDIEEPDVLLADEEAQGKGSERKNLINLGDALKLPLSSKTINNQRRKSLQEGKDASSSANTSPKGKIKEMKDKKAIKVKERNGTSPLIGKKVVILPHKIITKPFSKLTPKEFIKFLQIIVKILINFKIILSHTKPLTEVYNFNSILEHFSSMGDEYFEDKLKMIETDAESITVPNNYSEDNYSQLIDNSLISSPASLSMHQISKKSSISNIYQRIFGASNSQIRRQPSTPKIISGGIFGNVSEMRDSIEPENILKKDDGNSGAELDIGAGNGRNEKVTMQRVYQIMTGSSKNKMITSRAQLDDWDVISKMM